MGVDLYMMGDIPSFVHVAFPDYDLKHLKKAIAFMTLASESINPRTAYHYYGKVQRHKKLSNVPFSVTRPDWVHLGRNSDLFNWIVERDDPQRQSFYWENKYEGHHFKNISLALRTWSVEVRWNTPSYLVKEASQYITDLYIA